nr:MAG TPA_asm: adenine-specific methyltransferase [Caudoviricetes sp.]
MNGDFDSIGGSAAAYAWFVWEKGYKGETIVKWFN